MREEMNVQESVIKSKQSEILKLFAECKEEKDKLSQKNERIAVFFMKSLRKSYLRNWISLVRFISK